MTKILMLLANIHIRVLTMNRYIKYFSLPFIAMFGAIGCSATSNSTLPPNSDTNTASQATNLVEFNLPREVTNFPLYITALKQYARLNGISEATIEIAFKDVYHIDRVVNADRNQPERKLTLDDYLARAASPARIKLVKQKYLQYHSQISHASLLTNVPQPVILVLWGVESGFGRYQGNEDIISALATLSFDGRREQFFNKELLAALKILDKGYISKDKFKGSWAGAMGQNQFMPSSYLAYAKDGDGDGIIDIWTNMYDVFASTGNYLASVGWQAGNGWGNKVSLPKQFNINQEGLDNSKSKTVSQWLKEGVIVTDEKMLPESDTQAWIILPDNNLDKAYMVYNNFKTIMHWNRSYYFALSVGLLSDQLMGANLTNE